MKLYDEIFVTPSSLDIVISTNVFHSKHRRSSFRRGLDSSWRPVVAQSCMQQSTSAVRERVVFASLHTFRTPFVRVYYIILHF